MKLEPRQIPSFLKDPGPVRCVLLYGGDTGLIRERATLLAKAIVPQADDPFRVAWLDRADHARLPEESSARSLTGGRRVVRVRDVGDSLLPILKTALAAPVEALLILEAPDLPTKSKLRAFIEPIQDGASIGCYPEDAPALSATIRTRLSTLGVRIDPDVLPFLIQQLGADKALTQGELEKLALYAGPGGCVDLEAARACLGDVAALSVEDALYAATSGDIETCDHALSVALAEGMSAVGLLRAAQSHCLRLHRARLTVDQGTRAEDAARAVRPPFFFARFHPSPARCGSGPPRPCCAPPKPPPPPNGTANARARRMG